MFHKKQKSDVKPIHLVTDDSLYNRKTFHKVKTVFIHPLRKAITQRKNKEVIKLMKKKSREESLSQFNRLC